MTEYKPGMQLTKTVRGKTYTWFIELCDSYECQYCRSVTLHNNSLWCLHTFNELSPNQMQNIVKAKLKKGFTYV
jgi:hypothetical protein